MKSLFVFLALLVSCKQNGTQKIQQSTSISSDKLDSSFTNKTGKKYLDSFCFTDKPFTQCCFIFSSNFNDSLLTNLGRDELEGYNFSLGSDREPLLIKKYDHKIDCSIYFLSNKDWVQKIVLKKITGDTLFIKMELVRKGSSEDMWFHKIQFTYENSDNKVSTVILDDKK